MKVRELTHEEAVMLWKMGMRDLLVYDVWKSPAQWRTRGPYSLDLVPTNLATYGVEIVEE